METTLGVTLGLGGKATPGVVDTARGIRLSGSPVLAARLAAVILTAGLARVILTSAHCILRHNIFRSRKAKK